MSTVTLVSKATRDDVAYHEAAHIVAITNLNRRFEYVDIIPDPEREVLGHVITKNEDILQETRQELLDCAFICLAAPASDQVRGRWDDVTTAFDRQDCYNFMRRLPEDEFLQAYEEVERRAHDFAIDPRNRVCIEIIAQALLERETLTYQEVLELLKESLQ